MTVESSAVVRFRESSATVAWRWTALGCLGAAGALHLVGLAAPGANGLVQLYFLLAAVGQLVAAALLAGQVLGGQPPAAWTSAFLLAGTVGLVALELLIHTTDLLAGLTRPQAAAFSGAPQDGLGDGLLATATVTVEASLVVALVALLPAPWRRRATNLLLGVGAVVWCLWLAGAPV